MESLRDIIHENLESDIDIIIEQHALEPEIECALVDKYQDPRRLFQNGWTIVVDFFWHPIYRTVPKTLLQDIIMDTVFKDELGQPIL